jgi:hypothetical protein
MWWILIIVAIIVLVKWLNIKTVREGRRKAAQEYIDENCNNETEADAEN